MKITDAYTRELVMEVVNVEKPKPIIYKPATGKMEVRIGRGFSIGELKEVGLSEKEARKLGIYVDRRRKSIHNENIEILRKFLEEVRRRG